MGSARTTQFYDGTGSRARAIQAYYPFYPPPVYPLAQDVKGGYSGPSNVPPSNLDARSYSGLVNARFNRWGERQRYSFGAQIRRVFRMMMTGGVESSQANNLSNMPFIAQFNDHLYRAATGYPRNMGLSTKVPSLPKEALGQNPWGQMGSRPQFTRNVFTNRNYATVKQVPAKPSAS